MKILNASKFGTLILGFSFGIAVALALTSVTSRAQNSVPTVENTDPASRRGNCTVRTGTRRLTNNISYFPGEVVTGVMTTSYYCSPLIVDCSPPEN